ncbi:methyl-accepting chemotaxis protein [Vitiosangium sp. GDMCC 1.1324]|uniref:methyl-accepting chemotaxis protein n=1 Tax=Vitiosangium sp. (strain GDMCC 1.1324) TaxID=2138576 RepID=UPI000D3CD5A3|nr:CHASE3 domain-containing protein [Vitiosangium sp. GDMCC 1.1324]PTL83192.1 chemotaxis protein [Vitiosangium sp. GDMCC 1.1324]
MSIGKKIALGFGLSLVMLLAVSLVAFQSARQLNETAERLVESRDQGRAIREVRALLVDAETGERGYLLTGDERYLQPFERAIQEINTKLDTLRQYLSDEPDQHARLAHVEPLIRERLDSLNEVIRIRREQGLQPAVTRIEQGQGKQLMDQIRQELEEMLRIEDLRWADFEREASASAWRSMVVLGLGTVLGLLIVGLGSYLVTRSITGPLDKLVTGAEQIGRGNFAHRIEVHNEDETGELARAFNAMAERRQQAETQLAKQAGEREHTLRTVAEFVNQLAGTSAEILASTTEQVAGAQEQGSAVAQTVSTIEEIAQTSEEAAGRARGVSESARHSEEVGKSGRRAVEEAIASMGSVREQVESIASRILALAEQAQAIGDIITTVNDISEQTHMLALNASIEASRAGEHGRGFAVVAAEVKALADQSKKATNQVRQILGQIQKATQGAVMTTEEGTKSVASATRVVTQAGAHIQTLSELLAQASLTAAQISASANQQATGIGQIRQAMRDVSQATQQALTSTRQTERAVQELNAMGQKLKGLLSEYGRAE